MSIHPVDRSFFKEPQFRHGGLKFFFTLSSLIGILPYNKNCETTLFLQVYSALIVSSIVLTGALLTIHNLYFTHGVPTNSITFPLLFLTQEILQSLLWMAQLVCLSVYKNRFKRLIKSVVEWSANVKSLKFSSYWTSVGLTFFPLYFLAQIFLETFSEIQIFLLIYYLVKMLKELGIYLILMQFCTFLEIIEKQLDHITRILGKTITLETFTEKHFQLVRTASCVNDLYSWQLLIICTLNFINFVSWLFFAMRDVLIGSDIKILPCQLSYCAWQLLNIYFIAGSCEKLVEKAEDFNYELFRIMRESNVYCNNPKLNLYVTMKQSINFTACGFFSLGYPLVTSIISSATTYLVILVQFSMSSV